MSKPDDKKSGAAIVAAAKALPTDSYRKKGQAAVALFPVIGGALAAYWAGADLEKVVERIEEFAEEVTMRLRRLEAQDNLDEEFLATDEAVEIFDEMIKKAGLERDTEKRRLYAAILANTARVDINRSSYPTVMKLLDALEFVHVEILRELQHQKEKQDGGGGGEQDTATRELAIELHLDDLEELRVGQLLEAVPETFGRKLNGMAAWDEAIGAVANYGATSVKALIDTVNEWDEEILGHIWYLGKEGLVHQATGRRTRINELGARLLSWLSEPENSNAQR